MLQRMDIRLIEPTPSAPDVNDRTSCSIPGKDEQDEEENTKTDEVAVMEFVTRVAAEFHC